ncbi:hypothetical protein ACP70R_018951 [Stipagrostis hirtigluma subsp. patula]
MELAMGAMAPLFSKLYQLLEDEYVAQKGLKREIESQSKELAMMHAALVDVSKVPPDQLSELDKLWACQVRELSYDMEDAIDVFMVRVAARQLEGPSDANVFKKIARKVKKVKGRHQISNKIKEIKDISKELGELRERYKFSGTGLAMSTGVDPRVINLYKHKGELIGVEKSRDELIQRLTYPKDDKSLKIVSIVGCGGLGKTTLAQLMHDHLKSQSFDCSAFVSMGRNPNITNTLREMLEKLDEKYNKEVNTANWDEARFCEELHKFLQKKRYNIVVDDVWERKTWETINCALPNNNCGSKVIITTRNFDVSGEDNDVYKLQALSPDKSKELFYKRTSGWNGDNQLAEVVDKIIDKCDGVPLSIIAIASLLDGRPLEDWHKVYDSIIFGCEEDKTRTILLYSYYDLPSYLKPCLLYLSMYPEDRVIEKSDLIWRWIAEGFVQLQKEGDSLFEVAEEYFNELLNRSMIQAVENRRDSIIDSCLVHDIVLDLIRDLSVEENFVTILGEKQHGSLESVTRSEEVGQHGLKRKVRRISIQRCLAEHIPRHTLCKPEVVRSIHSVSSEIEDIAPVFMFQACRVLVTDCHNSRGLRHLGRLLHLRYVEIVMHYSEDYGPLKEIENLKYLQTLRLKNPTEFFPDELPPTVYELRQLMCLHAKVRTVRAGTIGKLECLEVLNLEVTKADEFVVELRKLIRLRVLNITFCCNLKETACKALAQSLSNLQEIREMKTSCTEEIMKTTMWEGWEPPRRLWRLDMRNFYPRVTNPSRFQHLCYLSLFIPIVEEKDLETLAQLPELLCLNLDCCDGHQGYVVGDTGFKKLRICKVQTTFKFLQGAAPRLESLSLEVFMERKEHRSRIPTRDAIPDFDFGLGNLPRLKQVSVTIQCTYSLHSVVEEVEAMVWRAVEDHPNRPAIQISRDDEDSMLCEDQVKPDKIIRLPVSVRDVVVRGMSDHVKAMLHYRWLEEITYDLDGEGATYFDVLYVEEGLRDAATRIHLNRPNVLTNLINQDKLKAEKLNVHELEDCDPQFDYAEAWQKHPFPEKISFVINCEDARLWEVEKLESALRHAVVVHQDRPVLLMNRINEDEMVSDNRRNSELGGHHASAGNKKPTES